MRISAIVASVLLVACSRGDKSATEPPSSTTTITAAEVASTRPSDDQLLWSAETALATDPALSKAAAGVEVDVHKGVVTLRGATLDPEMARVLEDALSRVPGVVTTLNKLEVRDPSPEEVDDTMSFSLQRALVRDPAVAASADHVTIEVRGGAVTLRGHVPDAQARAAFERVANRTPGVVSVENLLEVIPVE